MDKDLKEPKLTVLMPVYNASQYLNEAIQSVLNQTYTDFIFLIIDDGSTDTSRIIIESYKDPRILFIQNPTNKGIIDTLNFGINKTETKYIARMDADDLAVSNRFELQVNFMEQNPDIGICGGSMKIRGSEDIVKMEVSNEKIKACLLSFNSLSHPTVILRTSVLKENGYRYPQYQHAEDYALWLDVLPITNFANLDNVLVEYRMHELQVSSLFSEQQKMAVEACKMNFISRLIHDSTVEEKILHQQILRNQFNYTPEFKGDLIKWLQRLYKANREKQWFNSALYTNWILTFWKNFLGKMPQYNMEMFWLAQNCIFHKQLPVLFRVNFFFKCFIQKHNQT